MPREAEHNSCKKLCRVGLLLYKSSLRLERHHNRFFAATVSDLLYEIQHVFKQTY
jgi:hypothetical protein